MEPNKCDPQDESTLLDIEQLEPFIDIGLTDFLDILGDVIHDVPEHLEIIHAAIRNADAKGLKSRAHTMRGMLANFGCVGMTSFLHTLEHSVAPSPEDADAIRAHLDALWQKSLAAIRNWEKSIPGFAS